MSQRVSHERVRQLLAARLDGPISRSEHRLLAGHLRACEQCRLVDHDYRAQRAQLRSLPTPIAPRDMWPRTSAALDRELARSRGRFGRRRPAAAFGRQVSRGGHSAVLAGLLVAIGGITALATFRIVPNVSSTPPQQAAAPTPFSVAGQQLAFVGGGAEKLAVYQTQVSRMCPTSAPDCVSDEGITSTPIVLPNGAKPRNVALSPSGRQLVVVGGDVGRDVFAVVLLPSNENLGSQPGANGSDLPASGGDRSQPPVSSPSSDAPTSGAGSSQEPASNSSSPVQADGSSSANLPPTAAVAGLTVLAILDNVHSAGAPPEWSADGSMLAFSAMPADGSHGPDVYVWQPSDTRAQPVTNDHASFFASWSGSRIVASRLLNSPSDGAPQVGTVVIDPQTLDEQVVDGPQMWLPAVNARKRHSGRVVRPAGVERALPTPGQGGLYLADWARLDPYAPGNDAPQTSPSPATASPSDEPATPTPDDSAVPASAGATPDPSAQTPSSSALGQCIAVRSVFELFAARTGKHLAGVTRQRRVAQRVSRRLRIADRLGVDQPQSRRRLAERRRVECAAVSGRAAGRALAARSAGIVHGRHGERLAGALVE